MRTALTTAPSIEGNASFKVFSACCCGDSGLGGLGGGISSAAGAGCALALAVMVLLEGEEGAVSSSKSRALAVVGDSARVSFYLEISRLQDESFGRCMLTGFSGSVIFGSKELICHYGDVV